MKNFKKTVLVFLSLSLLTACQVNTPMKSNNKNPPQLSQKIKKNPSTDIPAEYFRREGTSEDVTKTITHISWVDNSETNKFLLKSAYSIDENFNYDDFKILKLTIEETIPKNDNSNSNTESIYLTEDADIVLGSESQKEKYYELSSQLKSLSYQHLSKKLNIADVKNDLKAEFFLAIPKQIAENKALQLKINKINKKENKIEAIYLDLN